MTYLDNAATTQVSEKAARAACEALVKHWANPSALYKIGAESEMALNDAREAVAQTLGAAAKEIIFTACGSESNNIAILGAAKARGGWGKNIVVTGYEHPSVQLPVAQLEKEGFAITVIPPDEHGHVDADALVAAVNHTTALVCAMHVNNEVGSVLDVATLARRVKQANERTAVHIDGVQAWGKQPIALQKTVIDTYSVSGHKIHAPKGIGALYIRNGYYLVPPFLGGGQEHGMRPGTENIALAVSMAAAAQEMAENRVQRMRTISMLQKQLCAGLAEMPDVVMNSPQDALCDIVNFSVMNIKSETMLHFLESRGVYVSSGSACSKGAASHTLLAMGLPKERIDSAIRVSFSGYNNENDVKQLLAGLADGIRMIRRINA